jgi:hypothetical protein
MPQIGNRQLVVVNDEVQHGGQQPRTTTTATIAQKSTAYREGESLEIGVQASVVVIEDSEAVLIRGKIPGWW